MANNPNWGRGKKSYASSSNSNKGTKKSKAKPKSTVSIKVSTVDNKPVEKAILGASFKRLKPIIVETGWLTRVVIVDDGVIELNNSWTELIMWLISLVYNKNTDKFMRLLVEHSVVSDGLLIHNGYIHYPSCSDIVNEIYKISNSEYYVDFRRSGVSYIQAINGLLDILHVELEHIKFDIEPLKLNINGINTTYNDVKQVIIKETLEEIVAKRKFGINITGLAIFNHMQKVNSAVQGLIIFMAWALASYGKDLEKAGIKQSTDGVGLTTTSKIEDYDIGFTKAKFGEYYLYCCEDVTSILRYIDNISTQIGLSSKLIEIEYKTLELKKNKLKWREK